MLLVLVLSASSQPWYWPSIALDSSSSSSAQQQLAEAIIYTNSRVLSSVFLSEGLVVHDYVTCCLVPPCALRLTACSPARECCARSFGYTRPRTKYRCRFVFLLACDRVHRFSPAPVLLVAQIRGHTAGTFSLSHYSGACLFFIVKRLHSNTPPPPRPSTHVELWLSRLAKHVMRTLP